MAEPIDLHHLAYQHAPVGIVLTEHRIIKSCNDTFATLLGYRKKELINQSFRMLYSSRKEFDNIRDVGIENLRKKGFYSDERMVIRKDGTHIWCRFRAKTLTPESPLSCSILSFALISDRTPQITLSPRERQVIGFLSKGQTSKEIARNLEISPRTVEDIRSRLLKKFGMKNATELLAHLTLTDP